MTQPGTDKSICEEIHFDALFREHALTLRNFCLYKCQDPVQAEDYVQEAFTRLWKRCAEIPFEKAKSYLFKISQNLFLDHVKHQKVVTKYLSRIPTPVSFQDPGFHLEEKELLQRIEQAIEDLTEKQRVVFLLQRMDGKSYKEIAEMLDISIKTVEKRMHRALLSLRTCIPQL